MRTLSISTATKLFATGFTVGPIVDSLHNQCLLKYEVLPISLAWPTAFQHNQNSMVDLAINNEGMSETIGRSIIDHYPYAFCSSWTVPPLLGFAYVVLGGVLPRIVESATGSNLPYKKPNQNISATDSIIEASTTQQLRSRALFAVTTTALIIKLSEFLETHPDVFDTGNPGRISVLLMAAAATLQWAVLDRSLVALLVATVTALGGPLSELPFVGHGIWTYLEGSADYFPLQNFLPNMATIDESNSFSWLPEIVFGTASYRDLGLSSITGPCYFAVAMDAIALGRWFDTPPSKTPSSSLSPDSKSLEC